MKRGIYLMVMVILAAGTLAAQNWGPPAPSWNHGFGPGRRMPGVPGPRRNRKEAPEAVTVQGNLGFSNGYISLEQDNITYYILGLGKLIGFVDGLKEGAPVILEGAVLTPPGETNVRFLWADKLTFNGKEYGGLSPASRMPKPGAPGTPPRPFL